MGDGSNPSHVRKGSFRTQEGGKHRDIDKPRVGPYRGGKEMVRLRRSREDEDE